MVHCLPGRKSCLDYRTVTVEMIFTISVICIVVFEQNKYDPFEKVTYYRSVKSYPFENCMHAFLQDIPSLQRAQFES